MTYEFEILGRLKGMNDYTNAQRANPYKGAQMKKIEQQKCEISIRNQIRKVRPKTPVRLHYIWYEKDRCRDLDNVSGFGHKVIQDALVKVGILPNDGWNEISGFTDTFSVDKYNPRILVLIEEVDK